MTYAPLGIGVQPKQFGEMVTLEMYPEREYTASKTVWSQVLGLVAGFQMMAARAPWFAAPCNEVASG